MFLIGQINQKMVFAYIWVAGGKKHAMILTKMLSIIPRIFMQTNQDAVF